MSRNSRVSFAYSDLLKIRDALEAALDHHMLRDSANAKLHMAPNVRQSPLTSCLESALHRLDVISDEQLGPCEGDDD